MQFAGMAVSMAAAYDIIPQNWYETQWIFTAPMAEMFPESVFYTDYEQMLDAYFKAVLEEKPTLISVKEGLAMTLTSIYAEESAKEKGKVLKIKYPGYADWSVDFTEA